MEATGDGIKSDNETDADRGYVLIENGTVNITSGDDGINISGDNPQGFTITGGAVTIDSEGDGLDSNAAGTISGGSPARISREAGPAVDPGEHR